MTVTYFAEKDSKREKGKPTKREKISYRNDWSHQRKDTEVLEASLTPGDKSLLGK